LDVWITNKLHLQLQLQHYSVPNSTVIFPFQIIV